ncbi:MAG: lysophospholipase [Proteobacteria bacterium]|nr:lysophospholipase [Pseudomonadota bacterium]
MNPPSVRRVESHFAGVGGVSLFARRWEIDAPERCVLLVHGFGEHSGRYDPMAEWLAQRGAMVAAYDQRGHGRSGGRRQHVRHFDEYLDDLAHFAKDVAAGVSGLPCTLIGHSMGGTVAVAAARERRLPIRSLVTSGAALALSPDLSATKLRLARWLRRAWSTVHLDAGIDPKALSRDPQVVERYCSDPLVGRRMTAGLAAAFLDEIQRTAARAGELEVPVLVLHGGADRVCLPEGSERFHAGLRTAGSEFIRYPELKHEIFNEPEREQVWGDVLAWLRARESEGRAA